MNDLEMMIADARDDGDGHRNVLRREVETAGRGTTAEEAASLPT